MRYQVPQFIEVEDKIFGPLTLKQFIYIGGVAGITVVLFSILPKLIAFVIAAPIVIFGLALAFYKINNRPFIEIVEAFFKFHTTEKLYIWKKKEKKATPTTFTKSKGGLQVPKLADSKLKDLTWSLDVKEQNNPTTE